MINPKPGDPYATKFDVSVQTETRNRVKPNVLAMHRIKADTRREACDRFRKAHPKYSKEKLTVERVNL